MWDFTVQTPDRLDRALKQQVFPGSVWLSRQVWERILEEGRVRVDGRLVKKGGTVLSAGAKVSVDLPALGLQPAPSRAPLVWASPERDFAVFFKKAGIATYPLFPWENGTLANEIAAFVEAEGWMGAEAFAGLSAPPVLEGGLVQRLDRDTSGLVCCAFTAAAKQRFRKLFSGDVEKTYLAIVRRPASVPDGHHRLYFRGSEAPTVQALREEKPGTQAATLEVSLKAQSAAHALVEVKTRFGLRHVVRAGMAALGAPLVGDTAYGGSNEASFHQLHAYRLSVPGFPPFEVAPPESFLACARSLGLEFSHEAGVASPD